MRENASITRNPLAAAARHQEAAIVGAEIERGTNVLPARPQGPRDSGENNGFDTIGPKTRATEPCAPPVRPMLAQDGSAFKAGTVMLSSRALRLPHWGIV